MEFLPSGPGLTAALFAVAFLAGMVDAIAGGGGLIMLPALLTAGLPPHMALGTNKLAGTFGTFSSARAFVRKGLFRPPEWRATIVATFAGAAIGTGAVMLVSSEHLSRFIPLLILATAIYMLVPGRLRTAASPSSAVPRKQAGVPLGGLLGFYDGFVGPGTGAFWTTAAMAIFRVDLLHASGIARFMNFVSNLVSLVTFAILSSVDYFLGLSLGLSLMLGAHIGAHSAIHYGAGFIRPIFVLVVMATAARLAWLDWFA